MCYTRDMTENSSPKSPQASLESLLVQAQTDLAFALAQGDGYAEDAADARITEIKARLEAAAR